MGLIHVRLGDDASVLATLMDMLTDVAGVYRSLAPAGRDVVRVGAAESDDGSAT